MIRDRKSEHGHGYSHNMGSRLQPVTTSGPNFGGMVKYLQHSGWVKAYEIYIDYQMVEKLGRSHQQRSRKIHGS